MEWPYLYIVKALELTVLLLLLRYNILLQGIAGGGGGAAAAGPRDFPVYVVSYFSTKSGNSFATFSFRHLW